MVGRSDVPPLPALTTESAGEIDNQSSRKEGIGEKGSSLWPKGDEKRQIHKPIEDKRIQWVIA